MKPDNIQMIKVADLHTKIVSVPGEGTKTVTSILIGRVDGSSYFVLPNRDKGKAKVKGKQQDQPDYFLFIGQRTEPDKDFGIMH